MVSHTQAARQVAVAFGNLAHGLRRLAQPQYGAAPDRHRHQHHQPRDHGGYHAVAHQVAPSAVAQPGHQRQYALGDGILDDLETIDLDRLPLEPALRVDAEALASGTEQHRFPKRFQPLDLRAGQLSSEQRALRRGGEDLEGAQLCVLGTDQRDEALVRLTIDAVRSERARE